MSAGIVTEAPAGRAMQRRIDDLRLQLKGLVHVRALLETRGVPAAEVQKHTDAIVRVRNELARLAPARAQKLAVSS
jgi:hypothetical protein